jgi:hypothetical protein
MPTFVALTHADENTPVYVNMDLVISMQWRDDAGRTHLTFVEPQGSFGVLEDPTRILRLIQDEENRKP